jgi:hypothetical protein
VDLVSIITERNVVKETVKGAKKAEENVRIVVRVEEKRINESRAQERPGNKVIG